MTRHGSGVPESSSMRKYLQGGVGGVCPHGRDDVERRQGLLEKVDVRGVTAGDLGDHVQHGGGQGGVVLQRARQEQGDRARHPDDREVLLHCHARCGPRGR
jgi:hypothetical protein